MTENDPARPRAGRHAAPEDDPATTELLGAPPPSGAAPSRPWRFVLVTVLAVAALGLAVTAGAVIDRLTVGTPAPAVAAPISSRAPAPGATTPTTTPPSTPTRTTTRASRATTGPTTTRAASRADTGPGCGQRAVTRGVFNPACSEYQGYLDPGRAGGREPSSGDLQTEYGCEKGYIPRSECPG